MRAIPWPQCRIECKAITDENTFELEDASLEGKWWFVQEFVQRRRECANCVGILDLLVQEDRVSLGMLEIDPCFDLEAAYRSRYGRLDFCTFGGKLNQRFLYQAWRRFGQCSRVGQIIIYRACFRGFGVFEDPEQHWLVAIDEPKRLITRKEHFLRPNV